MEQWYVTKTRLGVSTRRSQMRGDVAEMTFNKSEEKMGARAVLCAAAPELLKACDDCQSAMDAAANQLSTGEYIDPAEVQAACDQLAEYAMKARAVIAKAQPKESEVKA